MNFTISNMFGKEKALFVKNKEKLPIEQKNINSYTDLSSLYNVISKFEKSEEIFDILVAPGSQVKEA